MGGGLAGLETAPPRPDRQAVAQPVPVALLDLLYRCPECGHDPMDGEGDRVRCPSCGVRIRRTSSGLEVESADSILRETTNAAILSKRLDTHGGAMTRALQPGGVLMYSATVMVAWRISETAVRYRGVLRGFTESMGPPVRGTVTVDREEVAVEDGRRDSGRWRHLDICAVQVSSAALQLSLPDDRLVQLRFLDDSPRRWEELMRRLVTEAYQRAGRGGVVEFQPRIVTCR